MEIPSGPIDLRQAAILVQNDEEKASDEDKPAEQAAPEEPQESEQEAIEASSEGEVEEVSEENPSEEELLLDDDATETLEDEDDPEEAVEEPTQYAVKVDGEDLTVSLDELQKGYSRQASYTRKSQELSQQRKAFEGEAQAVQQERAQYAQLLPALRAQLEANSTAEPDWDKAYEADPIEAARQERLFRKHNEAQAKKLAAIEAEQKRVADANLQEEQAMLRQIVEGETATLMETVPGWSDAKVFDKERRELSQYLIAQGITEQEIGALIRAPHITVLRKAMLFDRGVKRTKKTQKQGTGKSVVRPGSAKTSKKASSAQTKRSYERLRKTGKLDDAAELMKHIL